MNLLTRGMMAVKCSMTSPRARLVAMVLLAGAVLTVPLANAYPQSRTTVQHSNQVPHTVNPPNEHVLPSTQTATASVVTTPTKSHQATTPVAPKPVAPKPAGDPWMATFSRLAASLPGEWYVRDAGALGATCLRAGGPCAHAGQVFIARRTPLNQLASVMKHESMHVRQSRIYGLNVITALAPFGGIEAVADCGARMLGATWTHYVKTCTPVMNHAAQAMLNGVPA